MKIKLGRAVFPFILLLLMPIVVNAHVKWFTDIDAEKETIYHIISPSFIAITLISAFALATLPQILPKLMEWEPLKKMDTRLEGYRKHTYHILKYGTAIALFLQVLSGALFAPELVYHPASLNIATWIAIIFLLIPHHVATKTGAIVMLILYVAIVNEYGLFHMLDYAFYLAIGVALLLEKTRGENWGFPFLYLVTGLSLCWVAVEKWVYPTMAVDIIISHQVPTFMFPPELFVSLTAFIEFIVGYLLVVGILNRLLSFILTCIFIMTTLVFGWVEVVGHFMIHIILITFIIEGISFYKPPVQMHKTVLDQIVFVFLNFIFVLATILLIYYRFA